MGLLSAASGKSAWRGYEYYTEKKVQFVKKLDDTHFGGAVQGNGAEPYRVTIDTEHPKRSLCSCPFANGRKVCKHMVALFFAAFPEEAIQYKAEIDACIEQREQYENELEDALIKRIYRMKKSELQDALWQVLLDGPEWQLDSFMRTYVEDEY